MGHISRYANSQHGRSERNAPVAARDFQWTVENDISAGYPEPPCKPTSPRRSTLGNQHGSIGFRAYLTIIFLGGAFIHPSIQL